MAETPVFCRKKALLVIRALSPRNVLRDGIGLTMFYSFKRVQAKTQPIRNQTFNIE
jgi:hypothetical protein